VLGAKIPPAPPHQSVHNSNPPPALYTNPPPSLHQHQLVGTSTSSGPPKFSKGQQSHSQKKAYQQTYAHKHMANSNSTAQKENNFGQDTNNSGNFKRNNVNIFLIRGWVVKITQNYRNILSD